MSSKPPRIFAHQKLVFQQDLQADPTLSNVQKGLITTIATNYDPTAGHSPASVSFMARGAGTTVKVAKRYAKELPATGRVEVKRPAEGTRPTWWNINWFFRGSAYVRAQNGGPIKDCRAPLEVPRVSLPSDKLEVPRASPPTSDTPGTTRAARGPRQGTESHLSPYRGINVPLTPAPEGDLSAPPGSAVGKGGARLLKLTIVRAVDVPHGGKIVLELEFEEESGAIYDEMIVLDSDIQSEQVAGQSKYRELLTALDMSSPDEANEFVGAKLEGVDRISGLVFIPASPWGRRATPECMGIVA